MIGNNIRSLALLALCALQMHAQGGGVVTGLVLDAHGDPLVGASVHIEPSGKGAPSGYFDWVPTDEQGRFVKRNLNWGSYDVFAMKEADGYPNHTWYIFKDDSQPVKAVLSETNTSADVTVRLGSPAARLSSVHVSDAATGRPIVATEPTSGKSLQIAGVNLIRDDMKTPTGLRAQFAPGPGVLKNILVPNDVPVIVQVYAEGYADWYYPGVSDPSKAQPLRLKSGESLSFDVRLQPLLCLSMSVCAQTAGTITGVVVTDSGDPVPHARVRLAEGMRAMDLSKTFPAGDDGRFVISNVKWGTYTMQAMKPEEGYPDPFVLIYRYHVSQPTVTVSPAMPAAEITVPIGPKAGTLLVRVADGATGKALGPATLTLRRRDDPRVSIQIEAASDAVLIPATAPLMIAVHVDGYSDWYYPGTGSQALGKPLTLSPGEEARLDVRLSPITK